MTLIEQFVRRYARRAVHNGVTMLTTNGDPLLQAAFADLGWSDPCPEVAIKTPAKFERAVIAEPVKGRVRG